MSETYMNWKNAMIATSVETSSGKEYQLDAYTRVTITQQGTYRQQHSVNRHNYGYAKLPVNTSFTIYVPSLTKASQLFAALFESEEGFDLQCYDINAKSQEYKVGSMKLVQCAIEARKDDIAVEGPPIVQFDCKALGVARNIDPKETTVVRDAPVFGSNITSTITTNDRLPGGSTWWDA